MVKCFVTGATGFIGSHIVRLLSEKEHSIDVLVRKTSRLGLIDGLPVSSVTGDITDPDSLFETGSSTMLHECQTGVQSPDNGQSMWKAHAMS
jgi:dihydroflavonol-4-reductase